MLLVDTVGEMMNLYAIADVAFVGGSLVPTGGHNLLEPASLGAWFTAPNAALDGLKPVEVIERGEIDRLWEMVIRLRSGMPG